MRLAVKGIIQVPEGSYIPEELSQSDFKATGLCISQTLKVHKPPIAVEGWYNVHIKVELFLTFSAHKVSTDEIKLERYHFNPIFSTNCQNVTELTMSLSGRKDCQNK